LHNTMMKTINVGLKTDHDRRSKEVPV